MDFMTAVKTCLTTRYADFQGRARRSEYWWFALGSFLISIVLQLILGGVAAAGSGALAAIAGIVYMVVLLGLFIPSIAVLIRRLHDTGRSGWFALLFLIPIVGIILALIWLTQRGTVGANDWGADPYDAAVMA